MILPPLRLLASAILIASVAPMNASATATAGAELASWSPAPPARPVSAGADLGSSPAKDGGIATTSDARAASSTGPAIVALMLIGLGGLGLAEWQTRAHRRLLERAAMAIRRRPGVRPSSS
jgi:hypothetical protein